MGHGHVLELLAGVQQVAGDAVERRGDNQVGQDGVPVGPRVAHERGRGAKERRGLLFAREQSSLVALDLGAELPDPVVDEDGQPRVYADVGLDFDGMGVIAQL